MIKFIFAVAALLLSLLCAGCRSSESVPKADVSQIPEANRAAGKPMQMHTVRMPPGIQKMIDRNRSK